MSNFPSMVEVVPESSIGIAEVKHFEVSQLESRMSSLRGNYAYCPKGKYAKLLVGGKLYMSDTRMERLTNSDFVRSAHGRVLVAGLGLGMILHPLIANEKITSIVVVEKYQDVIDLISPTIRSSRVEYICADIFDWRPEKGDKFNVIYFDIWPDICSDNLDQMAKLHQAFKNKLDRTDSYCWMNSWMRDYLLAERRRENR